MYYIIYQTAFIGDIILATSMARTMKNIDPHGKIIFITTPAGKNLLQNNIHTDNIIVYDKRSADSGISGFRSVARRVKNIIGADESIFISPHRFARASIVGFLTGSRRRIGFSDSTLTVLYTDTVQYEFGIHEIWRNHKLLAGISPGLIVEQKPAMPELYPSESDFDKVRKIIFDRFSRDDIITAIAPGSVWKTKRWPEEYFKKFVELLTAGGIKIILLGGTDDMDLCGRISSGETINLAGRLSLLESAAAVSMTSALVTNDSAPLHMGSAMNVPTVAIFGSTTPRFGFGPLADGSLVVEIKDLACRPCGRHGKMKCPKGHFDCMNKIHPEIVYGELLKII
ncbi:MAG: glycosyltransferase family 9 protein [Spirochaetes bacterium]|nr:glycosyltransferase family 9 protein [Spirochaetota bacterium]